MLAKCQLCGVEFDQLTTHITRTHGISTDEYRSRFPGYPLVSDKFKNDVAKRVTGENNPMFGKTWTDEQKRKLSEKISGVNHPCYGRKTPQAEADKRLESWYRNGNNVSGENNSFYGKHHSEETRAKMRAYWANPESRKRGSRVMRRIRSDLNSVYNTPEFHELQSYRMRERALDPNSTFNSPEYHAQAIANFNAMIKDRRMCKFNKSERKLFKIIQQVTPDQYRYNGTGSLGFRVFRHLPDFVNVNGQKKVIELHGCYWHCCPVCGVKRNPFRTADDVRSKDATVLAQMEALGYNVLVIWTHELKNKNEEAILSARIREFHEQ